MDDLKVQGVAHNADVTVRAAVFIRFPGHLAVSARHSSQAPEAPVLAQRT